MELWRVLLLEFLNFLEFSIALDCVEVAYCGFAHDVRLCLSLFWDL